MLHIILGTWLIEHVPALPMNVHVYVVGKCQFEESEAERERERGGGREREREREREIER